MTHNITVQSLHIYPVKSLAGIALTTSTVDSMGLKHDRRWMLVSPEGMFLSQRSHPNMALIHTRLNDDQLILSKSGLEDFIVPSADAAQTMKVTVWKDTVTAQRVGKDADNWLSEALGIPCHLVYIPDNEVRQCDTDFSSQGDRTGFADGFPLLVISEASLDDLNQRLTHPVPMKRFRPNIVVTGCEAFAEDTWLHFSIGNLAMRGVKPCGRCVMTTVDPETGQRTGTEPLQTLMTYRKQGNNVCFGQNVIHNESGAISVGDIIRV